jgi:hypothetical protein
MSRDDVLHELQPKIASYQHQLTEIFFNLLADVDADQGFLAFENLNGKIGIVANKGDYWHLSRDQGATGAAVRTGKPSITDPKSANVFQKTDRDPYSELIYPIKFQEETVGAILFDNIKDTPFEEGVHYPIIARYIEKICQVLADDDPWNFRKWWQDQQHIKRKALFEDAQRCVEEVFDEEKELATALEARVESITPEGTLVQEGPVLGRSGSSRRSDRETVATALRTGEKIERPAGISRHECHVPFPLEGPVQGIVTLVAETQEDLPLEVIEALEKRLQRLEYQHYAPAMPGGRQGAEHYFNLVLLALTSSTSPSAAHETLDLIAKRAQSLCAAQLQIIYTPESADNELSTDRVVITPLEEVRTMLGEESKLERPYSQLRDEWLRCPIIVRGEVCGLVQVRSDKDGISNRYNSDIVVVVALLVAELLARVPSTKQ